VLRLNEKIVEDELRAKSKDSKEKSGCSFHTFRKLNRCFVCSVFLPAPPALMPSAAPLTPRSKEESDEAADQGQLELAEQTGDWSFFGLQLEAGMDRSAKRMRRQIGKLMEEERRAGQI